MKILIRLIVLITVSITNSFSQTQERKELLYSNRFSILSGLIQPVALNGFNLELNYFTKRLSFDYSHGVSLDPPVAGSLKEQNLALHLPYSTGFGVGYRLTSFFDIRIEPKLHSWEVYYKGEQQTDNNKITEFKTFTLGVGLYYRYFPFKNSNSKILQGITSSTSIRWWPNVGSTLDDDKYEFLNKTSGRMETLKAPNIGIANTPLVVNIAIGYTFRGK